MIPFFVLDRPVSLEILKGFFTINLEHKFGILTHAFTSTKFQEKFRNFPYDTPLKYCKVEIGSNELNDKLSKNIIKFVDSGIFQTSRNVTYKELFEIYECLNADYGIIIDYLKDKERTVKSAKEAIKVYMKGNYKFKLVGVAQGKSVDEYLKCYEDLRRLGYRHIALGGLLKRNGVSNYIKLSCDLFLVELLDKINNEFSPDWLFTLGIYNPKRHKLLEEYGVWGADYKGWLFEYEEDYSFVLDYIEHISLPPRKKKEIKKLIEAYSGIKSLISLNYTSVEKEELRNECMKLRKKIDTKLKKVGLSLQQFRFMRVRENLQKKIVETNLHRDKYSINLV
jgi:hypothetical protein